MKWYGGKMVSREQIFDAVLANQKIPLVRLDHRKVFQPSALGYRLLERARNKARWILDGFRAHSGTRGNPQVGVPEIYFAFTNNMVINGFAFTDKDCNPYIGVFAGAVFLLYDFFYRVLSHPGTFPQIGNAKGETIRDCHKEGINRDFGKIPQVCSGLMRNVIPNDLIRSKFAEYLAECAFDFLIIHEWMHICKGHCDYNHTRNMLFLFEATCAAASRDSGLTDQAIEAQADGYAANASFFTFVSNNFESPQPLDDRMHQWVFSVGSALLLLGCKFDMSDLSAMDHPPPPLRLMFMHDQINERIKSEDKFRNLIEFDKAFQVALTDTRVAFEAIGGSIDGELSDFLTMCKTGEGDRHSEAIGTRMFEIHPAIQPFAYSDFELIVKPLPKQKSE